MLCLYLEGVTELELNNTDFVFFFLCASICDLHICVCMYVYVRTCMCVNLCACVCKCLWRPEVDVRNLLHSLLFQFIFFDLFCHKINTGLPGTQVIIPVCENPWSYLLCHGISSKSTKELPHCHSVPNPTPHTQSLSLTWERQQEREMAQIVRLGPFYCP